MEDPHESWKDWFSAHGPKLLLFARQSTRCLADAEDVLQEAFVRFWRNQRKLGGEPLGLLFTSIRRTAIDLGRQKTRRVAREEIREEGEPVEPLFESPADPSADERRMVVERAIQALPAEQREVLVLKIWGERTFEQIAAQLEISPNTAASRYRYALTALRHQLTAADCHG
ncbi:MAG: sigma-70 family RNA polymerase sigma factor [Opitutus sp.]